jgi:acetylornithine deacetylase/succinyl-diaminopimelate desuccinylase-like protein
MDSLSGGLPGLTGRLLGQITNPALTDLLLKLLGERARIFAPLFHNTVCPTILQASDKINVIPSEVALQLDGRLLPGLRSEQMVAELCALLGGGFDIEILQAEPGPAEADMALFGMLSGVLRELDPAGKPIPYVNAAVTDARYLSRLGIQTYGFTPLKLPNDFNFVNTIHAADERVPIEALEFGAQAIYRVLEQFHQ